MKMSVLFYVFYDVESTEYIFSRISLWVLCFMISPYKLTAYVICSCTWAIKRYQIKTWTHLNSIFDVSFVKLRFVIAMCTNMPFPCMNLYEKKDQTQKISLGGRKLSFHVPNKLDAVHSPLFSFVRHPFIIFVAKRIDSKTTFGNINSSKGFSRIYAAKACTSCRNIDKNSSALHKWIDWLFDYRCKAPLIALNKENSVKRTQYSVQTIHWKYQGLFNFQNR